MLINKDNLKWKWRRQKAQQRVRMREKIEEEGVKKRGGRKAGGSARNNTRFFICYTLYTVVELYCCYMLQHML